MAGKAQIAMKSIEGGKKQTDKVRRTRTSGIDRALQIFDYLQKVGRPCTSYELAHDAGAPLSTVYVIVDDLVSKDLLDRNEKGLIWFGPRLYHYGLTYAHSLDLLSAATQEMQELAEKSGHTIQVCGRDGDKMVVLAMIEGANHFHVTSKVGSRIPLNWTASGRLLVGHLPYRERFALFSQSATPSPTGKAEVDAAALCDSARRSLEDRISIQAGESDFSIACIASPIVDDQGACQATLSVVVPDSRIADGELAEMVKMGARRIESRLGWRGVASGSARAYNNK
jgi:DNA-binding IclR family transcriptional regulator